MIILLLLALALLVFAFGPRAKAKLRWRVQNSRFREFDGLEKPTLATLKALRTSIAEQESLISGITENTEKHIVFFSESRPKQTKYAVLYVHGYSATRQEITPVPQLVVASLKANLYSTRLTGHGLDGNALLAATSNDWQHDLVEAWDVARLLGEKVIVIATSTGGSLVTWLAQQKEVKADLAALILVSPNYHPKHKATPFFLLPWARYLMPLIAGELYGSKSRSEQAAKYWTYQYPVAALPTMIAFVTAVRRSNIESIVTPTLFIYSNEDRVVSAKHTDDVYNRWGSEAKQRISISGIENDNNHVITGDIMRPDTTTDLSADIIHFIKQHAL